MDKEKTLKNRRFFVSRKFYKFSRKSQIQIGETVAVLFVFFLLIVIGFIFYVSVIKGNIESEKDELSQLKSIEVAQRVLSLPELQCSEDVVKERENCFDTLKLDAAGGTDGVILTNDVYYFDIFEFGRIDVKKIYPLEEFWNLYSKPSDDYKNNFSTSIPVSLYDPTTKKYSFGILSIETVTR